MAASRRAAGLVSICGDGRAANQDKGQQMEIGQLRRILDELEPGMSLTVPKDWVQLNVEGADETERDLKTIEMVLEHGCAWERDPQAKHLTFAKEAPKPR
jgi:hypothetical protein